MLGREKYKCRDGFHNEATRSDGNDSDDKASKLPTRCSSTSDDPFA